MDVYAYHFVDMFTLRKAGRWLALWLWLAARGAAQVPCSVTHSLAPGEERVFQFQRAGDPGALLCTFVFEAPLGATIAVGLLTFASESEQPDCNCGALRMYDIMSSGALQLSVTKCAGESAEGDALHASGSVALVTLSTNGCPAPSFSLVVGAPEYVDVALSTTPVDSGVIENTTNDATPPSDNITTSNRLGSETDSATTKRINSTLSTSPTKATPEATARQTTTPRPSVDTRPLAPKNESSPTRRENGPTLTTTKKP